MAIRTILISLSILVFLFSLPGTAISQPVWLNQDQNNILAVEFLKPDFKGDAGTSSSTMAVFAIFRHQIGEKQSFVGEVPFGRYSSEFGQSETAIGNVYLGVVQNRKGAFGEFGIRVPTASEYTCRYGRR